MSHTVCQEIIADMGFVLPTTPGWSWLLPGHPALPSGKARSWGRYSTAHPGGWPSQESFQKNPLTLLVLWEMAARLMSFCKRGGV